MKPVTRPDVPPLVSSWGALTLAVFSAVSVFIVTLAVVAFVRRDDVAQRAHDPLHGDDAGPFLGPHDAGHSNAVVVDTSPVADDAGARELPPGRHDAGMRDPDGPSDRPASGDAGPEESGSLDVAAIARSFFAPHEATLVACVRDARRRDPAAGDLVSFVIVVGEDGSVLAVRVSRSPSPFATRCLLDAASRPEDGAGAHVDVDVSTVGSVFTITRVSAPRAQ